MTFAAPTQSGDSLKPEEIVGQLLIVRPVSHETGVKTAYGDKDAILVNVCVLTQQNLDGSYGVVAEDVMWFQGKLVGTCRKQIGELILARMAKGTAKPGQSAPYELADATTDAGAVAFAQQWLDAHPEFTSPLKAPTQAAPQQQAAPAQAPLPNVPTVPQVPQPAAPPATIPQPAPAPLPAAAPAAIPQPGQLHPSVAANLSPEATAQLQALAAQQQAAPVPA